MNNSIKLKRRLTQTLTYLYLIGLSIVIIYPLLITIMSAFKAGNVSAFKLDTNIDFNFDNFKGLFTETLYGTWYLNTLIIALITMVFKQVSSYLLVMLTAVTTSWLVSKVWSSS